MVGFTDIFATRYSTSSTETFLVIFLGYNQCFIVSIRFSDSIINTNHSKRKILILNKKQNHNLLLSKIRLVYVDDCILGSLVFLVGVLKLYVIEDSSLES